MAQISLNAAMRSNLLSLQNTQKLMDQTQNRLSTGLKVNSALDNPTAYFTASALNDRASDLSNLMDSMGQAISTIKAADEGITAIKSFVSQAKAVAEQARDTTDAAERGNAADRFNAILDEIDSLAKDSGYKGVNLLVGEDLKVVFNEKTGGNQNTYTISGVDAETGQGGAGSTTAGGDGLEITKAVKATWGGALAASNTAIDASIEAATKAMNKLREYSSELGNSYNIVQTRESFTDALTNVLTEGADKLTLADMNEESANMLALQTRQQLGINSLSLASQAAQSVLKLF